MNTTWTTQKGSKIEIEVNHRNGILVSSKIWINGAEKQGTIRKHNGAMVFDFGQLLPIPTQVVKMIENDKAVSHNCNGQSNLTTNDVEAWKLEHFMSHDETFPTPRK